MQRGYTHARSLHVNVVDRPDFTKARALLCVIASTGLGGYFTSFTGAGAIAPDNLNRSYSSNPMAHIASASPMLSKLRYLAPSYPCTNSFTWSHEVNTPVSLPFQTT